MTGWGCDVQNQTQTCIFTRDLDDLNNISVRFLSSPFKRQRFAFTKGFGNPCDEGKAAVEIREGAAGARTLGNGLSYISLTVPYGVRVSRIYEAGVGTSQQQVAAAYTQDERDARVEVNR